MISKNMLYMSVSAQEVTGKDADRRPTYGAAVTLGNVWFNYQKAQSNGTNGKTPAGSGILYYDCKVSTPKNFTFSKNMKIVYQGAEYFVERIKPCEKKNGVEHYEIEVI